MKSGTVATLLRAMPHVLSLSLDTNLVCCVWCVTWHAFYISDSLMVPIPEKIPDHAWRHHKNKTTAAATPTPPWPYMQQCKLSHSELYPAELPPPRTTYLYVLAAMVVTGRADGRLLAIEDTNGTNLCPNRPWRAAIIYCVDSAELRYSDFSNLQVL